MADQPAIGINYNEVADVTQILRPLDEVVVRRFVSHPAVHSIIVAGGDPGYHLAQHDIDRLN